MDPRSSPLEDAAREAEPRQPVPGPLHVQRSALDEVLTRDLEDLGARGLGRQLLALELGAPGRVVLDGRELLDFASNDYLGLGRLPLERGAEAGSARASRLVTGDLPAHRAAEAALAEHVGLPSALLFTSGYAANVGTLPALVGEGDLVLSDELNHASLIDGCRLSRARVQVFPHRDLAALEALLERARAPRVLVVVEAVYSMEGSHAPLGALRALTRRHGAWLMVDEAHSLGVLGPQGRGACYQAGVRPEVLVGTLGKAFGAAGAFVAGSRPLRETLIHGARSFVFSTGLAPAVAAGLPDRVQRVQEAEAERRRQGSHCARLRAGLQERGVAVRGTGPILGAVLGDPAEAVQVERRLADAGILARAIRPPTVPRGTSRIRLVPSAAHSPRDIERLLRAL